MSRENRQEISYFLNKSIPDFIKKLPEDQRREAVHNILLNTFEDFLIELIGNWHIDPKDLVTVTKDKLHRHKDYDDITLAWCLEDALKAYEQRLKDGKSRHQVLQELENPQR